MITIVDYGMGNVGSIQNMLKYIGVESTVASKADEILEAQKLILPGVGAFDAAMTKINELGIREALDQKALKDKIPILGICLGMQLLTESSEEGSLPGLGWIPAKTIRFPKLPKLKIPHMGWNEVTSSKKHLINQSFEEDPRFYFVHSFFVSTNSSEHSLFKANHGIQFDAGIMKENIFGVQFHPEKSHRFGMQLLRNFSAYDA